MMRWIMISKSGAIEIPHTGDWRSTDAEYTTINATADGIKGSCWNNGPTYTRWFRFQATTTEVTAEMFTGVRRVPCGMLSWC